MEFSTTPQWSSSSVSCYFSPLVSPLQSPLTCVWNLNSPHSSLVPSRLYFLLSCPLSFPFLSCPHLSSLLSPVSSLVSSLVFHPSYLSSHLFLLLFLFLFPLLSCFLSHLISPLPSPVSPLLSSLLPSFYHVLRGLCNFCSFLCLWADSGSFFHRPNGCFLYIFHTAACYRTGSR